jgi:hypothetical protein
MMNITKYCKATRIANSSAAATGTVVSSAVDMQNYLSCCFIVSLGTVGVSSPPSTVVATVQQSDNEASSPDDYASLSGCSVTVTTTGDDQVLLLEVDSPTERYLRVSVTVTGGTAEIDGIVALQHKAGTEPCTHDATTVGGSVFALAPAES